MSLALDPHCTFLDELDARQDDLLLQLEQLNTRIETLLNQFSPPSAPPALITSHMEETPHLADSVSEI